MLFRSISVVFALPEDNLQPILRQLHAGATLTVAAYDRSQTTQLATGTLASRADTTVATTPTAATSDSGRRRPVRAGTAQRAAIEARTAMAVPRRYPRRAITNWCGAAVAGRPRLRYCQFLRQR